MNQKRIDRAQELLNRIGEFAECLDKFDDGDSFQEAIESLSQENYLKFKGLLKDCLKIEMDETLAAFKAMWREP